jgi:ABC-type transporter Mla MlaB component
MFRKRRNKRLLSSLSGRLETGNLNAFLSEAKTLLKERAAPQKIVVDLSKVEFLDSAGAPLGLIKLEIFPMVPITLEHLTDEVSVHV